MVRAFQEVCVRTVVLARLPFTADSLTFGGGRLSADLAGQGVVAAV